MVRVIEDVVPQYRNLAIIPTDVLIATLYIRGVQIDEIFGRFFEYEAHQDARHDELFGNDEEGQHGIRKPLTVADADLAGMTLSPKPGLRQPF